MSNRRVAPDNALTLVDVCLRLRKRLDWYGLPRLKPEAVLEADQDTIVAFIAGERRLQPVRLAFDRHTGRVRRSVVPHDVA
jgi:hypothetical protein